MLFEYSTFPSLAREGRLLASRPNIFFGGELIHQNLQVAHVIVQNVPRKNHYLCSDEKVNIQHHPCSSFF
jgi:hypothetical protein